MADKVRGIQLVRYTKIAFAPQFGFGAKNDRFIGREGLRLDRGAANG